MRAIRHRQFQDGKLFFYAAVEFAVVLMAPAGRKQGAVGELFQEAGDDLGALTGVA